MRKFNRVCLSATVYNLFIYLLHSSFEEIQRTFFFLNSSIPKEVSDKIEHKRVELYRDIHGKSKLKKIIEYKFLRFIKYPFLLNCELFAQDHIPVAPYIIGNHKYTWIEDGPKCITFYLDSKGFKIEKGKRNNQTFLSRIVNYLISPTMFKSYGNNSLCKRLIETDKDIPDYLSEKKIELINISERWQQLPTEQKQYILNVFNVTDDDIETLKVRDTILFDQAFVTDRNATEDELVEIYSKAITKVGRDRVIIKKHPRSNVDYSKHFPDIPVFNKPVPFQLLTCLGIVFKQSITICSSAASSIPYDIKVLWIGTSIHAGIRKAYGDFNPNHYTFFDIE